MKILNTKILLHIGLSKPRHIRIYAFDMAKIRPEIRAQITNMHSAKFKNLNLYTKIVSASSGAQTSCGITGYIFYKT